MYRLTPDSSFNFDIFQFYGIMGYLLYDLSASEAATSRASWEIMILTQYITETEFCLEKMLSKYKFILLILVVGLFYLLPFYRNNFYKP